MKKIIDAIKESQNEEEREEVVAQEASEVTWLVFSVNEETYALEASMAKEILRNMDLYPLPFVPGFIKGVINRHGDPYTVVDLSLFLGGEVQESSLFIVLNLPDNQFCIQISDILDFHTAKEDSVIKMSDVQDTPFYNGTIEYRGKNVPIILADKIYDAIRIDFDSQN